MITRALFWGSIGALGWTHVGYPLAVAGLLSGIALGPAMLIAGLLITLPALTTRRLGRTQPVTELEEGEAA